MLCQLDFYFLWVPCLSPITHQVRMDCAHVCMCVCVCVAELGGQQWGVKEVRAVLDKKNTCFHYCSIFLGSYFITSHRPIQHSKLIFIPLPSLYHPISISRDTIHIPTHFECNVKHKNAYTYAFFFFICYSHVYYSV